ncbi:MAG: adenosylcobalamin-dependent ribonucleoside-diphosphate reductase, partial [Caldimicrobium sp.]
PDIEEFITANSNPQELQNFNLSVGIKDDFVEALKKGTFYSLINPRTGKETRRIEAEKLFSLICEMAWLSGDPGLIFLDTINRFNPTPHLGKITATNPCGEQPLLPYESCNLGSINLANFVKDKKILWEKLRETIHLAVRFLDDVIEINHFPHPLITKHTLLTRKIGLGIMGFADMLIKMQISYQEDRAVEVAESVMKFIQDESLKASAYLATERGAFPAYPGSLWDKKGYPPLRNATTTTIAPTGSLSLIAGVSSGIEPLFGLYYERKTLDGIILKEFHPLLVEVLEKEGIKEKEIESIKEEIKEKGLISKVHIKENLKPLFYTAYEIPPEKHLAIQQAFQKYTHNAVSKTINLPASTTVEEVKKIFLLAHNMGLKGLTVYRYGSKPEQVIYIKEETTNRAVCPKCGEDLEIHGSCFFCGACGYDKCP